MRNEIRIYGSPIKLKGFSLLEVLLATAISVLIYMGSYALLDSVLLTDEALSAKRESLEKYQRAFRVLHQDIEQIIPRKVVNKYGEKENPVEYSEVDERLSFTHLGWRNPLLRRRSTMQRVSYFLEDEKLYREHWPVVDLAASSESKKNVVLDGITNMEISFYEASTGQWRSDWSVENGDKESLPAAIEVKIESKEYEELARIFVLVENQGSDWHKK